MSEFQGHLLPRNLGVTSSGGGGGGIASINNDSTSAQVFVVGTTGTDFAIVDTGGGNHVWELPIASAVNTGKLSSTDWSTFNSKISAALTSLNADTTAAQLLTIGSAGTDFAITNPGAGSHVLNLPTASSVNTGKLAAADWTTFNSKQTGNASLTALAALASTGFIAQTGANTFSDRTLTGTANQVIITNSAGIAGNPIFSLPQDIATSSSPTFANLTISSKSAFGGDASLATAGFLWDFSQTITDFSSSASWLPLHSFITCDPVTDLDATSTIIEGTALITQSKAGNTKKFYRLQGLGMTVQHNGTGNITNDMAGFECQSSNNGSGNILSNYGLLLFATNSSIATGTITNNVGILLTIGNGGAGGIITNNYGLNIVNAGAGSITNSYGIGISNQSLAGGAASFAINIAAQSANATITRAIELVGTGVSNAIRLGSSANIYSSGSNNITCSDVTNVGGLSFGLTTTSATINTLTQNNASIILQNQTFTAGAQHFAVNVSPTWATENQNHVALSLSATQNGANTQLLIGQLISLTKATTTTTLNQATGILILGTNVTGTVTTNIGISIGNESTVGSTTAFAIQINNQSANATTTRAIELVGSGISNAIRFGSSVNIYAASANVLTITDSTNADGITFTVAASGAQGINTMSGNLSLAATTGAVTIIGTRHELAKGASVTSANNMTLGADGNSFTITGTTTINTISSTNWQTGSIIILIFSGVLTVANNTAGTGASIFLAGTTNFITANNTTLSLLYDGTQWQEIARKAP